MLLNQRPRRATAGSEASVFSRSRVHARVPGCYLELQGTRAPSRQMVAGLISCSTLVICLRSVIGSERSDVGSLDNVRSPS
jgi:hypothetical protein